jgi:hypothetical protein
MPLLRSFCCLIYMSTYHYHPLDGETTYICLIHKTDHMTSLTMAIETYHVGIPAELQIAPLL